MAASVPVADPPARLPAPGAPGWRVANFGGNANHDDQAGAFYWHLNHDSGNRNRNRGARDAAGNPDGDSPVPATLSCRLNGIGKNTLHQGPSSVSTKRLEFSSDA